MAEVMHLYVDDSGTRHPDRQPELPEHGCDWFGLGGIMVSDRDEEAVRARHLEFCKEWNITEPLHSSEIRASAKGFCWIGQLTPERRARLFEDIGKLVTCAELTAIACVIDRPGYNHRYRAMYGRERWSLCKTAFSVVVERAAKFARDRGVRLRVFVEKSDKRTDAQLRSYYEKMRSEGHPFRPENASKYMPLTPGELRETLHEFRPKAKTSPPMQIADLVLWPMCIGGYRPTNKSYVALRAAGTLIDCKLPADAVAAQGIKYSCWDLVTPK